MGLVSVQFGFFIFQFSSVFRFQTYETKLNIFLNILISFFSWFGFFGFFFLSLIGFSVFLLTSKKKSSISHRIR